MPKLENPGIIALFVTAFTEAQACGELIRWKQSAIENMFRDFAGYTPDHVENLILSHLNSGGKIQEVKETRPEYLDFRFHYDFVVTDPLSKNEKVYIETVITCDDPELPEILIVSCHKDRK